jgi:F1F0 ATPase subunit 2
MPWTLQIAVAVLVAGFGLGLLFFGGLWFTVRALPKSRHPALLVLLSYWTRTALVVVGFVFLIAGRWQNAVLALIGFVLSRLVLAHWIPTGKELA